MEEIWKEMVGEHAGYAVSNLGNVKSLQRTIIRKNKTFISKKERILKNSLDCLGYLRVHINQKCWRIHVLVCIYFIRPFNKKECCNHLDGNKLNNDLSNLEITSYKENNLHAYRLKLRFPPKTMSRQAIEKSALMHQKAVALVDKNGEILKIFTSIKEAGEQLNISSNHIGSVCQGKRKSTGKMKFVYLNKENK